MKHVLNQDLAQHLKHARFTLFKDLSYVQVSPVVAGRKPEYMGRRFWVESGLNCIASFNKQDECFAWMAERGLTLTQPIDSSGVDYQSIPMKGEFVQAQFNAIIGINETPNPAQPHPAIVDFEELYQREDSIHGRVMFNGDYLGCAIVHDDDNTPFVCFVHTGRPDKHRPIK